MAIEQLMQAVLTATPAKRRELERVIRGETANATTNKDDDKRLITITAAARLLAVGRSTIYKLLLTGRLDAIDLNGVRRVTMKSVKEFADGMRPANKKTAMLIAAAKARYAADKAKNESEVA